MESTVIHPTKAPTIKSLMTRLRLDKTQAMRVRHLLLVGIYYEGDHYSHSIMRYLENIARNASYLNGVESLYPDRPHIFYVNAGDSYADTLILTAKHTSSNRLLSYSVRIGDIGSILERM
jgi:hypothetical protein